MVSWDICAAESQKPPELVAPVPGSFQAGNRAGTINDFSLAYSQATSAFTHVGEREMNNLTALVAYFRAERLHYFGAPPPPPATHRAESVGMSVKSRPI